MSLTASFLDIVSGDRRGISASIIRALLRAASAPYRLGVAARNAWYDRVRMAGRMAGVPVIAVGNITTGGSGKTPMTAHVAAGLMARGMRVGILMRGYRGSRDAREAADDRGRATAGRITSDEALLLPRLCPQARVFVNANRGDGARRAVAEGCTALVMDDGFQHRRLRRDLDIVLVDAQCPFGYGYMLPRGLLREPATSLRRAGIIIVTRSDMVSEVECQALAARLARLAPAATVLRAAHAVTAWTDVAGRKLPSVEPAAMRVLAFAGIARFSAFADTLEQLGVEVLAAYEFPDHHAYTNGELQELSDTAESLEANAVVTTEKDAVKLIDRWPAESTAPLISPRVEIQMTAADQSSLDAALAAALGQAQTSRPLESRQA